MIKRINTPLVDDVMSAITTIATNTGSTMIPAMNEAEHARAEQHPRRQFAE